MQKKKDRGMLDNDQLSSISNPRRRSGPAVRYSKEMNIPDGPSGRLLGGGFDFGEVIDISMAKTLRILELINAQGGEYGVGPFYAHPIPDRKSVSTLGISFDRYQWDGDVVITLIGRYPGDAELPRKIIALCGNRSSVAEMVDSHSHSIILVVYYNEDPKVDPRKEALYMNAPIGYSICSVWDAYRGRKITRGSDRQQLKGDARSFDLCISELTKRRWEGEVGEKGVLYQEVDPPAAVSLDYCIRMMQLGCRELDRGMGNFGKNVLEWYHNRHRRRGNHESEQREVAVHAQGRVPGPDEEGGDRAGHLLRLP